jgi:hypothetical protein
MAAAQRGNLTGCAALGDLICEADSACATVVVAACPMALDALAARLEAPFTPQSDIDFSLSGAAHAVDTDGDLVVDALQSGTWSTSFGSAAFTGARTP